WAAAAAAPSATWAGPDPPPSRAGATNPNRASTANSSTTTFPSERVTKAPMHPASGNGRPPAMPFRRAQDSWRTRLSACFRHGLPALLLLCLATPLPAGPPAASPCGTVRLALVNVPDELLRPMLPDFEKETGLRAEIVYTGSDPYGFAREGKADLVISHFGHAGVEPFVTEGLGLWPRAVFSNQMAL